MVTPSLSTCYLSGEKFGSRRVCEGSLGHYFDFSPAPVLHPFQIPPTSSSSHIYTTSSLLHQIKTIHHPIGPLPIVRNLSASNIVSTCKPEVLPTSPSCSSSIVFAVAFHGEATVRLSYEFLLQRRHLSEQLVVVVTQYNDQIHASSFLPIYCTSVFLRASTEHSPS